ncbi:MAG: glycogen-binding domain-containing protein [Elusimicrobia bacterium]|nr:glycogen-binding domain-containing protein [Elusimicrobiota bacterium]
MTKSKTFWAAAGLISLALMAFAGFSIYERITLHFSGDTIEVHPVPMPPPQEAEAAEEETQEKEPQPEKKEEKKEEPKAVKAAAEPARTEPQRVKAVKTAFSYKDAKAKSVEIAGSFTSWKPKKMAKKNGAWEASVYILPGTYPYHFIVDGKQKTDPGKPKAPTGDSLVKVESPN